MTDKAKLKVRAFRPLHAINAPVETNARQEKKVRKISKATGPGSFYSMLSASIGLPDLNLCLDAGDKNSAVSSTSQTWFDMSGNDHDYFRGNTDAATTNDPTFNGTAGARTSSEFYSFDGGDYFTETSTSQTFFEPWHRGDSPFTIVGVVQRNNAGRVILFSSADGVSQVNFSTSRGTEFTVNTTNNLTLRTFSTLFQDSTISGTTVTATSTSLTIPNGEFFFCAGTFVPNGASSPVYLKVNASSQEITATGNTNSLLDLPAFQGKIGLTFPSLSPTFNSANTRIACLALYSRAATSTQLDNLYAKVKKRFTNMP